MKITILDSNALASNDLPLIGFSSFGEVSNYSRTEPDQVIKHIGDAEIVLTNKTVLTNETIDACPSIKYIGVLATGVNVIKDLDYVNRKGIVVTNIPDYSTNAVAQLTFAFMMQLYNKVSAHDLAVKRGQWENCDDFCFYYPTSELYGKTIGIIGYGNIAKQVARLAQAFDMNVLVRTRTPDHKAQSDTLHFVDLDELIPQSDIISIHCPLTNETRGLFDINKLMNMKKSAILINTARGPIIDEKALAAALNSGLIAGAAVDVVSKEPILSTNPLLKAKNCLITPHIAWASWETRQRLVNIAMENIQAFLNGNPINQIN